MAMRARSSIPLGDPSQNNIFNDFLAVFFLITDHKKLRAKNVWRAEQNEVLEKKISRVTKRKQKTRYHTLSYYARLA